MNNLDSFINWQKSRFDILKDKQIWGPDGFINHHIEDIFKKDLKKFKDFISILIKNYKDYEDLGNIVYNGYCQSLDLLALINFIRINQPSLYFEVGSGNSTMIASKTISNKNLDTKIISIDPEPRRDVDLVCDKVIRNKLEDLESWEDLDKIKKNDIVFIDSSHVSKGYSDVSMVFSTLIPRLPQGVIVHIHDIHLPFNYPKHYSHWNEQYLLIPYLLSDYFEILFPTFFICHSKFFKDDLRKFPENFGEKLGSSIWLKVK
jgi:hypothetical protein